jgi:hypothetical protein
LIDPCAAFNNQHQRDRIKWKSGGLHAPVRQTAIANEQKKPGRTGLFYA